MPDERAHPVNRGYLRDLGDDECWAHMGETGIGRVATCSPEGPVILPVNYLVDNGTLIVRTAAYTQLAAHVGETLAFEIDDFDPEMQRGWSVLIVGKATTINDPDELAGLGPRQRLEPWAPGSRNLFIRITPRQITGRDLR